MPPVAFRRWRIFRCDRPVLLAFYRPFPKENKRRGQPGSGVSSPITERIHPNVSMGVYHSGIAISCPLTVYRVNSRMSRGLPDIVSVSRIDLIFSRRIITRRIFVKGLNHCSIHVTWVINVFICSPLLGNVGIVCHIHHSPKSVILNLAKRVRERVGKGHNFDCIFIT